MTRSQLRLIMPKLIKTPIAFAFICIAIGYFLPRMTSIATLISHSDGGHGALTGIGRDLMSFALQQTRDGRERGEVVQTGRNHSIVLVHGVHDLQLEKQEEAIRFQEEFKSRLSNHVTRVLGMWVNPGIGLASGREDRWGDITFNSYWSASHASGGGLRPYTTLVATYERDWTRGTVVLHVSVEPKYATLTIVETSVPR